jgi:DegV family protein with EDD domain
MPGEEAKTAVVCDSTSYLPSELVEANGIREVSLYVTLEGRQEAELEIADYTEFYDRLRASEEGATTSQPSVGDFLAVYEPLLAGGGEVVSIHLSAGISGTCEAATQARQRLIDDGAGGERIHVYDSRTACAGFGLVALAAAKAARGGASAEQVLEQARAARDSLELWFAVDTLEYLKRGGRIGSAQALLGSTLRIKPILTIGEEIAPVERVRTRKRAHERLVEFARGLHEKGDDGWAVQHIQDLDSAQRMAENCTPIFGCEPQFISEIGPVIGAHTGPGLVGVGSVTLDLLSQD